MRVLSVHESASLFNAQIFAAFSPVKKNISPNMF